jgi:hypothetical protein
VFYTKSREIASDRERESARARARSLGTDLFNGIAASKLFLFHIFFGLHNDDYMGCCARLFNSDNLQTRKLALFFLSGHYSFIPGVSTFPVHSFLGNPGNLERPKKEFQLFTVFNFAA